MHPLELDRLKAQIARQDPLLVAAMDEVDPTLLAWALSLSPLERLEAATRASRSLSRFHHAKPPSAG
jgi:hypothetical protein